MKKLTHPRVSTITGEIAVSIDNQLTTLVGGTQLALTSVGALTRNEVETSFVPMDNIPVTRVGDLTYLPLDVKDSFKGAIAPWGELPYMLTEADGSLVMLRPGYNGEFQGLFYSYSNSGSLNSSEFRHTDAQYTPLFLGPGEYVSKVVNPSSTGMLCQVQSHSDLAIKRFFWIEHNGTLDSRFHTYLDVTANMTATLPNGLSNGNVCGVYVPSLSAFVMLSVGGVAKMGMVWYTVNRPFQSTYVSATAPVLPARDVNWTELSGNETGTNNAPILVDGSVVEKRGRYFKFLNEPAPLTTFNIFHPSSGYRRLSYSVSPTGQIRFLILCEMYIVWTTESMTRSWYISMEFDPATNALRPTPTHDDVTLFQPLPYVIDCMTTGVDQSPAPSVITDAYKANKYPVMDYSYLQAGNTANQIHVIGDNIVVPVVGNSSITAFATEVFSLAYPGDTTRAKVHHAHGYFAPTQTKLSRYVHRAIDASLLSKSLGYSTFVETHKLRVSSDSQLYGEAGLRARWLEATVPSLTPNSQIYSLSSNRYEPALPTHTNVVERTRGSNPTATSTYVFGADQTLHLAVLTTSDVAEFIRYNFDAQGVAQSKISLNESNGPLQLALNQISLEMADNSTYKPSGSITRSVCLQLIKQEQASSSALFLITTAFGGVGGVKYEYATIRVPVVSDTIDVADIAYNQILGSVSGTLIQGPSNLGPTFDDSIQGIGTYEAIDGTTYIITQGGIFASSVDGNQSQLMIFKLDAAGVIVSQRTLAMDPMWYKSGVGAHPTYGLYATHTWFDSGTKVQLRYKKGQDNVEQGARLTAACEALLASGFTDSFYALSSKSTFGFVMYCSAFPVFMNGKYGIIPTQQIKLTDFATDPANKTFLLYVTWNVDKFIIEGRLLGDELPETATSCYIGSLTTNAFGIVSSSIKKVTRLDNFRIDAAGPLEGSSIRTYEILPELEAYIFESTAEVDQTKTSITPDSQATVFSKWDRVGQNTYYPTGVGATGNAAAWQFATNPDRVIQPNNVGTIEAFTSPYKLTDYDFEVTLSSANADNDLIGLIAAFARSNGYNVTLAVWRSGGGIGHPNNAATAGSNWDFAFAAYSSVPGVVFTPGVYPFKKVQATRGGWNGGHTRVKISRRGDIIKAWCTPWSASRTVAAYDPASEIAIDLSTIPEMSALMGEAAYGYATLSQPLSTYYDAALSGGMDTTRVYDLQTGVVWQYNFSNGTWEATTKRIQDEIGYTRYVTNPITGYRYVVAEDGIYRLN